MEWIDFNRPSVLGDEMKYIQDAIHGKKSLCGNGHYTRACARLLETGFGVRRALLTSSCTDALEISALLLGLGPDDEFILPSYTFVSTANAFALRGARPVFVDIREDTLNLDESRLEAAITPRTKAIVPVHYAGVGAQMDAILSIAGRHGIPVVEDAAQAIDSAFQGKPLGTFGALGTLSFHETKNCICGEGGALFVNDESLIERAEILLEKGTNRKQFREGRADKYTWVDVGSSYAMSELNAAFLFAQLERKSAILAKRLALFGRYLQELRPLEERGLCRLPAVPEGCAANGHMFYLLCASGQVRTRLISHLKEKGVEAVFHYVPLHSSPLGAKLAPPGSLPVTDSVAQRIIRLPMFFTLSEAEQGRVIAAVHDFYRT
jgi:dTDP-4-amino-4,6-dideoxygalactose transaminase